MTWYPAKRTTLTGEEAARVFAAVLPEVLGLEPTADQLAVVLGQSAGETGNWQSMFGWNFGNQKVSTSKPLELQDFQTLRISEILNGKEVFFAPEGQLAYKGGPVVGQVWAVPPGHPQTRFKWYPTAEAGARSWAELLTWTRYTRSRAALETGDPAAFSRALKLDGYYTASESLYTKLLVDRANNYRPAAERAVRNSEVAKLSSGTYQFRTNPEDIILVEAGAVDLPGVLIREADPQGGSAVLWEMQLEEDWTPPMAYRALMQGLTRTDGPGLGTALLVGGLAVAGLLAFKRARK